MIELALAGAPLDFLFFGREELPVVRQRADAAAGARAGRRRAGRDDGADRQRHPRRLPGQHQRDLDVHRPRRALRAPVARRQRDPPGGARASPRSPSSSRRSTSTRGCVLRGRVGDDDRGRHRHQRRPRQRRRRRLNYRYAPGRSPEEAEARLRGAVRRRAASSSSLQRAVRPGPGGNAHVRAAARRGSTWAPKQAWTPVAEFGRAGPGRDQLRPRRARAGPPARRVGPRSARSCAAYRVLEAFARVRLSPVLAGLRTYPFVRLTEAKRELAAEGVEFVDFGIGEPREETPPFIREALAAAIEPLSAYPSADGLPELREAIAGWAGRRFGVALDPDTEVVPTLGLQGGDLRPRPGRGRRAGRACRRPPTRSTSAARCSPASSWWSCRCAPSTASCPTSTRSAPATWARVACCG